MENTDYAPPRMDDSSRPSIGFPLGTALLLIIIFCLSGVFSCCYHWDKLRSLRRSPDLEAAHDQGHAPPVSKTEDANYTKSKENGGQSLTVLMPGDVVPKFIALPCPCEPPQPSQIIVHVDKPRKPLRIPVPLYL